MHNVVVVFGEKGLDEDYVLIRKSDLGELVNQVHKNKVLDETIKSREADIHVLTEKVKCLEKELASTEKARVLLNLSNSRLAGILYTIPDWVLRFFTGSTYRG